MSCKQNICSLCGGASTPQPNFQKQVDPPIRPYGTILGDDPNCGRRGSFRGGVVPPLQICLPTLASPPPQLPQGRHNPGQQPCIVQVPKDPARSCPKIMCDPCPPPPPTKVWLIKSSPVPQKCACLPIGGVPEQESSGPPKLVICLPCPPPVCQQEPKKKEKKGPIGLVTHCKEVDLIGGKFVGTCFCGMRNGLSAESCPRISCQNNPGCFMTPPQCWPMYKEEEPQPQKPVLPKQELICIPIEIHDEDESYPFAVPRKMNDEFPCSSPNKGKQLPPPANRTCSSKCIHVTDLKSERECTYHLGIPCPADCFNTKTTPINRG